MTVWAVEYTNWDEGPWVCSIWDTEEKAKSETFRLRYENNCRPPEEQTWGSWNYQSYELNVPFYPNNPTNNTNKE